MKLTEFMRGKWSFLAVNLLTAGAAAFLLYLVRAELYFSVFLPCFLFVGGICSLLPEYIGKRRYYRALQTLLAQLDRRYLLSELLEYPDFFEGQALCDALRAAGKSMNDEIAGYKRASAEYREYIELWVHEIKTPIAAAMLCAENSGASAVLEELEKIEGFVEQALFYARSSHVEKDYSIKETALAELVGCVLRQDAKRLIARKISVQTEDLTHTVRTDAKWLRFILRQMIDNSIKYGATRLEFVSRESAGGIVLLLRDNGVGIPTQELARVFEKGFTGENGRRFGRSTGLGLYLCRLLCQKMGLELAASSVPGEGATMEIRFPLNDFYV